MSTIAIHEECGRSIAEHCAFCDTCTCGCPVEDTIGATAQPHSTPLTEPTRRLTTMRHNYLLRSKYRLGLIRIMSAARMGLIRFDGVNWTHVNKAGEWLGNCTGEVRRLDERSLLHVNAGNATCWITSSGFQHLEGAEYAVALAAGLHPECGKPMAEHCTNGCDECPRTAGPCWCTTSLGKVIAEVEAARTVDPMTGDPTPATTVMVPCQTPSRTEALALVQAFNARFPEVTSYVMAAAGKGSRCATCTRRFCDSQRCGYTSCGAPLLDTCAEYAAHLATHAQEAADWAAAWKTAERRVEPVTGDQFVSADKIDATPSPNLGREHADTCAIWGKLSLTDVAKHCWCDEADELSIPAYVSTDERGLLTAESALTVTMDGVTHTVPLLTEADDATRYVGNPSLYEVLALVSRALTSLDLVADFSAGTDALRFGGYDVPATHALAFFATRK